MQTIVSELQNTAKQFFSDTAFLFLGDGVHESSRITYGELDEKARAIAAYLQQQDLQHTRVLLLYPAGIDFIVALMGCFYASAIPVPMNCSKQSNFEKSAALIETIAADADITAIFAPDDFLEQAEQTALKVKPTADCLVMNPATINVILRHTYRETTFDEEAIAYLQYTSGSTSAPKAAIITHQQLIETLRHTTTAFGFDAQSVSLSWAPHSHVYGLVVGILVPLYRNCLAIVMPTDAFLQKPANWLRAISHYRVTHSGCPNFGYELCAQTIRPDELTHVDLTAWKVAINGGEVVQQGTLARFVAAFQPFGFHYQHFCPAYGMSEATGAIAVTLPGTMPPIFFLATAALKHDQVVQTTEDASHRAIISNGVLLSNLTAVIVDPDTQQLVRSGDIGEVWLRGSSIAAGYWRRPDETEATFNARLPEDDSRYFRTGDLGFSVNNQLCLTGRLKEVLVIYGEKYYPLDIETAIRTALQADGIQTPCAVFSIPVAGSEQLVVIQEIAAATSTVLQTRFAQLIRRVINQQFGLNAHAIGFVAEATLPKTTSGKLQRKRCQAQFLDNTLPLFFSDHRTETVAVKTTAANTQTTYTDFIQLIAEVLQLPAAEIQLNSPVSEYGFDSITLVRLSGLLQEKYKLEITPATFFEFRSLADFYQAFFMPQDGVDGVSAKPELVPTDAIAVIGLACQFPGAPTADAFWQILQSGSDTLSEVPSSRWDWHQHATTLLHHHDAMRWGGFLNDVTLFDAKFFNMTPRESALTDPQQRLFLQTVWHAIEDAGYHTDAFSEHRTGLFVGVFHSDYAEVLHAQGVTDAYLATGISSSTLANRVSFQLNLQGPSEAINTACSSSLVAIHRAIQAIQQGDCEMAIAGGVNLLLSPTLFAAAANAGMLSDDGHCHVFDRDAKGYVRSEGVAALVLKPLQQALKDHDHIYGVIRGSAVNHGGAVSSLTVPNPTAQADVIRTAYTKANVSIDSIQYIEAHGTGTPLGDPIEMNGLKKAFSELQRQQQAPLASTPYCGVGSVKSNIGHTEAAAGIAGVIKVLLAMQHREIPASLHCHTLNPYIDLAQSPFYIVTKTTPWLSPTMRAGVSSFGFGGSNAHLLLESVGMPFSSLATITTQPYLITLSGKTRKALYQRIVDLHDWLQLHPAADIAAVSYTLTAGRNHFPYRSAFLVSSLQELIDTLAVITTESAPEGVLMQHEPKRHSGIDAIYQAVFANLQRELTEAALPLENYRSNLFALANFYIQGYALDWENLHHGVKQRISLPLYPFAAESHWIHQAKPVLATTPIDTQQADAFLSLVATVGKLDPAHIQATDSLLELGFDSIALKELATRVEQRYQFEVTPSLFFTYPTVAALSEFLQTMVVKTEETHSDIEEGSLKMDSRLRGNDSIDSLQHGVEAHEPMMRKLKTEEPRHFRAGGNPFRHEDDSVGSSQQHVEALEPIAIIGMQALLPGSPNLTAFWEQLQAGKDFITEIPAERWDWQQHFAADTIMAGKTNSKWGGFIANVDQFDASFFNISAREANFMDPQHRLMLEVVWQTFEDAGYDPLQLQEPRVGIFAGVEFNEYQMLLQAKNQLQQGYVFSGNSHALLANRVSYFLNLHGPSEVIDATCASSMVALHRAVQALRAGECEMAIASGVSLMLSPDTFVITSQLNVLSPDGRCKTFDKNANGYVKGEGVVAVLLKPLRQAEADGDAIYAVIRGTAENHGGKAQSLTAPNVPAQKALLMRAYQQACIPVESISYIETHGTGTELGDPIEIDALTQAFAALKTSPFSAPFCGLGSVKTNIGHLEPASGLASLIKVVLALQHQTLPGLLHFETLNPYIKLQNSPFYLVEKNQAWPRQTTATGELLPRRAGISSFGVGGTNVHVIVEEAPLSVTLPHTATTFLMTLSAKQISSLRQKALDLVTWLQQHPHVDVGDLSFTLNVGKSHFAERFACVVTSCDELVAMLKMFIEHNTLPTFGANSSLHQLAIAYLQRQAVAWQTLYDDGSYHRVSGLPAYPFVKKRYWYDAELAFAVNTTAGTKPVSSTYTHLVVPRLDRGIQNDHTTTHGSLDPAVKPRDDERNEQGINVASEGEVVAYLQTVFARVLRLVPDDIDPTTTYETYGVDSLLGLEIVAALEEEYGSLSKTLLYEYNQLRDLGKYLQSLLKSVKTSSAKNTNALCHSREGENLLTMDSRLRGNDSVSFTNGIDVAHDNVSLASGVAVAHDNVSLASGVAVAHDSVSLASGVAVAHDSVSLASGIDAAHGSVSLVSGVSNSTATDMTNNIIASANATDVVDNSITSANKTDVAIVGLSGIFPAANDMQTFWQNLVAGRDCITDIPPERWNYQDYPVDVGGKTRYFNQGGFIPDIDKFDPLFFSISPADAALMDPQERLFLQTAWATMEDAGYTRESTQQRADNSVGVFVGVTYNFYPLFIAEEWQRGNRLPLDVQLFSVANRVSYFLNFNGPSFTVDTACSSSLTAVHLAYESILRGECRMALAGGVNLSLHPTKYHMLGSYSFLSEQGRCTSFGAGGTGYVPGEGVGAVLLKPLADALRDGDHIYGVIKASHMNHGGKTSGYSVPNPKAQAALVRTALQTAKIDARTISYIEAHGTGTALGDPIEIRGLQEAFAADTNDKQFCAIGSVKSNIGHLESAAGISQIAKVLLQFQHHTLVPSLHANQLNPYIDFANTPFYVQREIAEWPATNSPRRAGVSSFGAGGANVHLILEEPPAPIVLPAAVPMVYLLSAQSAEQLREYAEKTLHFLTQLETTTDMWLPAACYTTQVGRESMSHRLAVMAPTLASLLQHLQLFLTSQTTVADQLYVAKAVAKFTPDKTRLATALQAIDAAVLADYWVQGANIPWKSLTTTRIQCVTLPTYPFAKRSCWVGTKSQPAVITATPTPANKSSIDVETDHFSRDILPANKPVHSSTAPDDTSHLLSSSDPLMDTDDWFYRIAWEAQAASAVTASNDGHWIIFSEDEVGIHLQQVFDRTQCSFAFASTDTTTTTYQTPIATLNPHHPADYQRFLTQVMQQQGTAIKGIIYLWGLTSTTKGKDLTASYASNPTETFLHFLQALIKQQPSQKIPLCIVTRSSQAVTQTEAIQIWQHPLWSMARIFSAEQPNYPLLLIDLDTPKELTQDAAYIGHEIQHFHAEEQAIAFRQHQRYVSRLTPFTCQHSTPWQAPAAALVTGGLGGIGSEVCLWLAKKGVRHVLITGNTTLPSRESWAHETDATMRAKTETVLALEKLGVTVTYVAVDVTDKIRMQQVITDTEATWQKAITGVFHLAGITTDSITIDNLDSTLLAKVLAVKMQGSVVLHDIFLNKTLHCFVLFSSIAALPYFGMSGLSAYAMANAFLDGFAAFRRQQGLPAHSIDWAAWGEKGMSFRYNHSAFLDAMGMQTISLTQGVQLLEKLLMEKPDTTGVFHINWQKFLQVNPEARRLPFFSHFVTAETAPASTFTTTLSCAEITACLCELLAERLGLATTEIDADAPYQQYGLDSIIGIDFVGKIGTHFPDIVSPMDLYRYPTLKQLSQYIFQRCHATPVVTAKDSTAEELSLQAISQLSTEEVSKMIDETLDELHKLK